MSRLTYDLSYEFCSETSGEGTLVATYSPADIRAGCIYNLLDEQVKPCVYRPRKQLADALFPDDEVEDIQVYNISEVHEGLGDRLVGWVFNVRYTPAGDGCCCAQHFPEER